MAQHSGLNRPSARYDGLSSHRGIRAWYNAWLATNSLTMIALALQVHGSDKFVIAILRLFSISFAPVGTPSASGR
jgi:hypothetical protein